MNKKIVIGVLAISFSTVLFHLLYLFTLKPTELFPEDNYLVNAPIKKALIVVAHDDDAILFSGTTAILASKGWDISFVTFYNWDRDSADVLIRKREMEKVADLLSINNLEMHDFTFRRKSDTRKIWKPIPYSAFSTTYKVDSLRNIISNAVEKYKPAVIFTLDSQIGFYGNPEHVLTARIIEEIFREKRNDDTFPTITIYQFTSPKSYAEKIMGETYALGKKVYEVEGMPDPDVQINISEYGGTKKSVIEAHASQMKNIDRYVPYASIYPGWLYFRIFEREHFKVIE